ncbi:Fc receptor-like protein 1 isoform X2 [Paramormyrops kingsleyae]|uniref:Fc receptor-like protein 1 isoform X2 n=1 Tax=Paramormyrops kingsleyae TaxID=1676925 RepID=UPI003B97C7CF
MRLCETFPWTYFTALVYFSQSADIPNADIRQNPPGPVWFSGETVTLECDIRGGSGWRYSWAKRTTQTGLQSLTHQSTEAQKNYIVQSVKVSDSGEYICQAERGSDPVIQSQPGSLYLSVSARPQAALSLDTGFLQILTKDSLTLRCEVEGSSVGWSYTWYADGSQLPEDQDGQTFTLRSGNGSYHREYRCRGNRTEEPFYSTISNGLVPNNIRLQHICGVSGSLVFIISLVLITVCVKYCRKSSGQRSKEEETFYFEVRSEDVCAGDTDQTSAIYEEISHATETAGAQEHACSLVVQL